MMVINHKLLSVALLAVFSMLCLIGPAQAQQSVSRIDVEGTQRVEPATVKTYLDISEGTVLTRSALDAGVKNLFATGLFADVMLEQQGSVLKVKVAENPVISQIAFEGNKKLDDDELMSEISLRSRQVFTRTKVQNDVKRLYQLYRRNGRFAAHIEPKVIKLDQNRINLVFEIDEGDVTKVKAIRFIGNDRFDDERLRNEISTKESVWYSFINNADRYDPDRLGYDQELLRQFYLSQGYADYNLTSAVAELSQDREGFYITFTLDEGKRYKVRDIKMDVQIKGVDETALWEAIETQKGDWYDAKEVQTGADRISDTLGDLQYAFVKVIPRLDRNPEQAELDLTYRIDPTPRAFIEAINISGNVRTLDKVIRREMLVVEGDPFNKSKVARSERQIRDLNFFETVSMETYRGSTPDKVIIDIKVAEKSTGEISLGAGFSSSDGVIGDISLSERNLLGKGQTIRAAGTLSGHASRFDVSFVEPYFLNRDVAAGVSLFNTETNDFESRRYDEQKTGGTLFMNYPLSERWRQTLKYRLNRSKISNLPTNSSRFLQEQEGERTTSAVSQRISYDNRDSRLFPTTGYTLWFETELAGLGFDSKHLKAVTGISSFYPIADKVVLNLLAETGAMTGYGDEDVEVSERFTLGGPHSFRGFESYGVGPRDVAGDDVGGNMFYRGSAEIGFPLGLPEKYGVKGYVFSDVGSLWDADETHPDIINEHALRMSAGVGVSWRSPFGPIGVYYANPFLKEDYDQVKELEVSFGTRF